MSRRGFSPGACPYLQDSNSRAQAPVNQHEAQASAHPPGDQEKGHSLALRAGTNPNGLAASMDMHPVSLPARPAARRARPVRLSSRTLPCTGTEDLSSARSGTMPMTSRRPRLRPENQTCDQAPSRRVHFALGLALVVAAFAAHFPAVHAGYIWDDDYLLYENPLILNADGLPKFWFSKEAPDYWPLTATTLWIEWRLWGNRPMLFHLTNIALHAAGA